MARGAIAPRSRSPQGAELAEITRAGSGLAAQMTVRAVVALGHVAGGGGPERRDAGKGAAEIRRRRIDKVAAAVGVVPGIGRRPAWRAHEAAAQVFPLPAPFVPERVVGSLREGVHRALERPDRRPEGQLTAQAAPGSVPLPEALVGAFDQSRWPGAGGARLRRPGARAEDAPQARPRPGVGANPGRVP